MRLSKCGYGGTVWYNPPQIIEGSRIIVKCKIGRPQEMEEHIYGESSVLRKFFPALGSQSK